MENLKLEGNEIMSSFGATQEQLNKAAEAEAARKAAIEKVADFLSANIAKLKAYWEDEDGQEPASWLDVNQYLQDAEAKDCEKFLAGKKLYIFADDRYLVVGRK